MKKIIYLLVLVIITVSCVEKSHMTGAFYKEKCSFTKKKYGSVYKHR